MLFRVTSSRTGSYLTKCVRNLRFTTPPKAKPMEKETEIQWTLVPTNEKAIKRKSPRGRKARFYQSYSEKLKRDLLDKNSELSTEDVVKIVHKMFTNKTYISMKVMSYLSQFFGRKGEFEKCIEVRALTKQLKLQEHHILHNGYLQGAANTSNTELAVEHLKVYYEKVKLRKLQVSPLNKECLLRAMVKQGMTNEVLDAMSYFLSKPNIDKDTFSADSPSIYLSILCQMSEEEDGAEKANLIFRELCGKLPTEKMGSDSYALLGSLLHTSDTPPYSDLIQKFLGTKYVLSNPLYYTYSSTNRDICILYETLITIAVRRRAQKPFMMIGGPEGLWKHLIILTDTEYKCHVSYIIALCKTHQIPLDQAFWRHMMLQYLNHDVPNKQWLDYCKFVAWYREVAPHPVTVPVWRAIIEHAQRDDLSHVLHDVLRSGILCEVLYKGLERRLRGQEEELKRLKQYKNTY